MKRYFSEKYGKTFFLSQKFSHDFNSVLFFPFVRSYLHLQAFFRSAVLNVHTILTAITAYHLGCFQTSCIIYKKTCPDVNEAAFFLACALIWSPC